MMETVEKFFDGVKLLVPLIDGKPMEFPYKTFEEFGDYCGAGKGVLNDLVPETICKAKVSPACYIHDVMFAVEDRNWITFHHANSVFLHNLIEICEARVNPAIMHRAYDRCILYYKAVDGMGQVFFFKHGDIA